PARARPGRHRAVRARGPGRGARRRAGATGSAAPAGPSRSLIARARAPAYARLRLAARPMVFARLRLAARNLRGRLRRPPPPAGPSRSLIAGVGLRPTLGFASLRARWSSLACDSLRETCAADFVGLPRLPDLRAR